MDATNISINKNFNNYADAYKWLGDIVSSLSAFTVAGVAIHSNKQANMPDNGTPLEYVAMATLLKNAEKETA